MPHPKPNFQRMLSLIDEVFATRNDPDQLQVTPAQLKKLEQIHPATLSEFANEDGPLIWVLIIPTTEKIMNGFLSGNLSEKQLLEKTKPGQAYDCIYLCSVTTLPEARGKGETKKLCIKAINAVSKDHNITTLFVWPFTKEGETLAESLANVCGMTLLKKSV
ncbi:MAG: GCN5-related N-acetyltransferase (GNAT)-like protein [Bacteroidetes bacterium]|jgi:hypothetical protein|nr:GCN5-related N-acetyltransferase (GNAT)-like protein [Bacteroidota bacterium]